MTTYKKKLIEVALPLDVINREAARENYIYKGNPSGIHKWWAQRPLAACRAVIFASLVDDPSTNVEQFSTEETQEKERQRLFSIIEQLVRWENSNDDQVLTAARNEILASANGAPPPICDPFCGGGSIPLEALRLGLRTNASDLNPVPVLITKGLIEIPPKFAGKPPVNPKSKTEIAKNRMWRGAEGLAEDVRFYGGWLRDEAQKRLRQHYPKVNLPKKYGGGEAPVIAWLWTRTVASPNPAAKGAHVPLIRSFWLSTRPGKKVWLNPVINSEAMTYTFEVREDDAEPRAGTVGKKENSCLLTGAPMTRAYIRSEASAGRMGVRLMAAVAVTPRGRVYVSPDSEHERIAFAVPAATNIPDTGITGDLRYLTPVTYGMTKYRDLFSPRQLLTLTTLCDLVAEAKTKIVNDSNGDTAYAAAVVTYLAFSISKYSIYGNSLVPWYAKEDRPSMLFGRQALPMVWDFTEVNPFSEIGGSIQKSVSIVADVLENLPVTKYAGTVVSHSAMNLDVPAGQLFSTDPPYYDNVPYADLSDFFYVWLRRMLHDDYPELMSTVLVPKSEELVADPFRQGGRDKAKHFFEQNMTQVMAKIRQASNPEYPATIYYAFKQTEEDQDDKDNGASHSRRFTGWETFLQALVDTSWQIVGTWPLRTERTGRLRDNASNALASAVVLVCRPRFKDANITSRRDFLSALKKELPGALRNLQKGNIAPVDLAQAAIGPGMAVFSRYARVLETDGSPMSVRTALGLINQALDEVLAEQEGEFDADTRWALAWFDQYGFADGPYGMAETLSTAKNTSVSGMADAGILVAKAGKVRLLRKEELAADWDPATDNRFTIWEATHHLIRLLDTQGEQGTADLIARLGGGHSERARDLTYRLYVICERRKWAKDAIPYNALVQAWSEASRLSALAPVAQTEIAQQELL